MYTGACAGSGAYCKYDNRKCLPFALIKEIFGIIVGSEAGCKTAYQVSNDDCVIVTCEEANVSIFFQFV